ncbi:MAG: NUDIX domain-containing protein [Bacteroidetes bacterium]|nr:NUDIX domain-containing protein [Bacteroidota bacterium]
MSGLAVTMIQAYVYRRRTTGVIEYLLLQRAAEEELYPRLWQMVTGRIENGETASAAAIREIREETGIEAAQVDVVPYVASFYFEPDDSIHHVPVFAVEVPAGAGVRLSAEHSTSEWLEYDHAWQRLVFPGHREGLRVLRDYMLTA